MLVRWLTVLMFYQHACAYNLDLRYPLEVKSELKDDYFGFNVAVHPGSQVPGDEPWMMVGAPHSDNNDARFRNAKKTGLVYRCNLNHPIKCIKMSLEKNVKNKDNLNGNMLGSSQDILNGQFVTCAPRWMTQTTDRNHILGECYVGDTTLKKIHNIQPLNTGDNLTLSIPGNKNKKGAVHPYFVYGEAGFAAHIPESIDKTRIELVLGAPGVFNWFGTTMLYNGYTVSKHNNPIYINPNLNQKEISPFALFGYALSSGKYFEKNIIHHAAGAPRGDQTGRVLIYTFPKKNHDRMNYKATLYGQQVGEYFGASLASCDIDDDGLDELFVGAPMYSTSQDEGRVYVFYGTTASNFMESSSTPTINRKEFNGRFGTSISCVGDLDKNGFKEIAIASPYDKQGVVYVYKQVAHGEWRVTQKITAPSDEYKGFGISISRGHDIDQNGYNDFAIGAYLSGHAVVVRSRPVVSLHIQLRPKVDSGGLARDSSHFQVEECIIYKGHNLPDTLGILRKIEIDSSLKRVIIDDSQQNWSTVNLLNGPNTPHCVDLNFSFKVKGSKKNYSPIKIQTMYQIQEENEDNRDETLNGGVDKFCRTCPILKNKQNVEALTEIIFATQCGADNVCNSDISVHLDLLSYSSVFIVGSAPSIPLRVTVSNAQQKDPAYNTRVELTLPVRAAKIPISCREIESNDLVKTHLSCDVADPLEKGAERSFEVELDMQSKFEIRNELEFFANTTTSSFDNNHVDNAMVVKLKLSSVADVSVSGSSEAEMYLFDTKDNKETSSKKIVPFVLRYQVERFGISPVHQIELLVNYPTAMFSGRIFLRLTEAPKFKINAIPQKCESDFSYSSDTVPTRNVGKFRRRREVQTHGSTKQIPSHNEILPANRTLYVNCTSGDWQCSRIRCRTGPFVNNQSIAILEISMTLDSTVLEKELGLRDNILYGTTARVTVLDPNNLQQGANEKPDEVTVSAIMRGRIPEGRVETWVLALSVMGGILLLLLLVSGLIKAGFFKRKEKDALIKLKRETQLDLAALQRMHDMEDQDDDDGMEDNMQDSN